MSECFPWQRLFRMAMMRGLAPDQLWQMTAGEMYSLLLNQQSAPVSNEILDALVRTADKQCARQDGEAA